MASHQPRFPGLDATYRAGERLAEGLDGALSPSTSVSVFNGQLELVTCNALYGEIFALPAELMQPGTHIAEILRYQYDCGTFSSWRGRGPDVTDIWLRAHLERLAFPGYYATVYRLGDGRRLNVSYAALADGGWIGCARDFTAYPAP